jgi:hypothetical protein
MGMIWKSAAWCSKALAFSALFLTFPPIFRLGKSHALIISFALTIFYFCKGLASLLIDSNQTGSSRLKGWNRSFNMLELPTFLFVIYGASSLMPLWIAKPYEWFLVWTNPIFTVLEGICVALVIYCLGKYFTCHVREMNSLVKVFILLVLSLIFLASGMIIVNIYLSDSLKVPTATLIGSSISLTLLLVALSICKEEGTVLDALLLFMYITYNIWTISRCGTSRSLAKFFYLQTYRLDLNSIVSWITPYSSVFPGFTAFLRLFSIDIIFGILFRVAVFLMSAKFLEMISLQKGEEASFDDEMTYNDLLLAFGKCILVMIYTYTWLQEGDQSIGASNYIWRWINVYITLAVYARNLFCGIDFDPEEE